MDYKNKEFEYSSNGEVYRMMSRILFQDDTSFGNYDLAERLIHVEYTKKANSRQVENLGKINNHSSFECIYNCCVG